MNHFRCEKHDFYSRKPQPSCPFCRIEELEDRNAKLKQENIFVNDMLENAHNRSRRLEDGKKEAVKEILEMLEEFRTSYSIIGYEAETVGTIAKKLSDAITNRFGSEI